MLVRFIKSPIEAKADSVICVRPDGSTTSGEMPRQGILPHDIFHFVVETTFAWHDAFFGQIAGGASLDHVTAKVHGQNVEWSKITQALQTESLVECLQAERWGGATDPATFAETLVITCRRRGVPPPDVTPDELDRVRAALQKFDEAWRALSPGAAIERTF